MYSNMLTETFASTISIDFAISNNFKMSVTGNTTINASNFTEGHTVAIDLVMDGVGNHTVTLSSDFEAYDNINPLDNSANKLNTIICKVVGTKIKYFIQTA